MGFLRGEGGVSFRAYFKAVWEYLRMYRKCGFNPQETN